MSSRPSVSILIPTRNRPAHARLAIASALAAAPPLAEVLVADNSDERCELAPPDHRLELVRLGPRLSPAEHWDRLLASARGEWIFVLEDRARLVPRALERLLTLSGNQWSVVSYRAAEFHQALAPGELEDAERLRRAAGELVGLEETLRVRGCRSRHALRELLLRGLAEGDCQLPRLASALVHRSVVERALRTHARFCFGVDPDRGSSWVLLAEASEYLETTLPATLLQGPRGRQDAALGRSPADALLETLLEFQRLRPEALVQLEMPWDLFMSVALAEITRRPAAERWRLHGEVLRAVQHDELRPRALYRQMLALMREHVPWLRPYAQSVSPPAPAPVLAEEEPVQASREPSLDAALATLGRRCRAPADAVGHLARPN